MTPSSSDFAAVHVRVPARVCLAAENMDWMAGPVVTCALDAMALEVWASPTTHDGLDVDLGPRWGGRTSWLCRRDEEESGPWRLLASVCAALQSKGILVGGVVIRVRSSIPCVGGLASSGAFCVGIAGALLSACGRRPTDLEVAAIAYEGEAERAGIGCGQMDHYAVSSGGVRWLDCSAHPPGMETLGWPSDARLVLGWFDREERFAGVGHRLRMRLAHGDRRLEQFVAEAGDAVECTRRALRAPAVRASELGHIVNTTHDVLVRGLGGSEIGIERLRRVALDAGAHGAKALGARRNGGAVCAVCDVESEAAVLLAMIGEGAIAIGSGIDQSGLAWRVDELVS